MVAVGMMAGASSSAVGGAATVNVSTHAGVVSYLRSLGIDPRGVVVQRGAHNYAGPSCAGRGGTCTTARRVLQIAASPGSSNTFVCPGNTSTAPDCVIVQTSTAGTNSATCQESSADPNANQSCQVSQNNQTGANNVTITQAVNTGAGSSQSPTQYAGVLQSNHGGANTVTLGQGITAKVNQVDGTGTQTQNAKQGVYISQSNSNGGTNSAGVNQSQSLKALSEQRPSLTQMQNTDGNVNTNVSLSQTSDTGANTANVNQSNVYVGNVEQAETAFQQQGSPGGGEAEFFTQSSSGVSKIAGGQTESQTERADNIGSPPTQLQYGPQWFDPSQGSNAADTYSLNQSSVQSETNPSFQDDSQYADCTTTGTCTANQSISQNGTKSTNTCTVTNGFCDINNSVTFDGEDGHQSNTCNQATDDTDCIPSDGPGSLPPAPPFPPAFNNFIN